MTDNGTNEPLLSTVTYMKPQTNISNNNAAKRRGLRRIKSAPQAGHCPPEADEIGAIPRSQSIFGRLHPSIRKVAIILSTYLGIGTVCFYLARDQLAGKKTSGVLDAVYFCIVTMTTVGYGDLVPKSVPTKLLACAFVFTGMALVGIILSKAADYLVEKQEVLLVKAMHVRQKIDPTEIMQEVETNKVRYKCLMTSIFLLVLIISGTAFLATVEKMSLLDAFYCVCCTITTLGYGDASFSTKAGRFFAAFWILISSICLAQFFLYIAEVNTENRRRKLVKWVLSRRTTNVDLEAADIDDDGVVGAPEFVIYKLKEMGKITEEDVALVMKEFEQLDVDQSGTLSASDIRLAQS